MSGEIKPFALQMRLRNNLIAERRQRLGLSVMELARQSKVSAGVICAYELLHKSPFARDGWSPTALRLATFLGVLPEDLWPDHILKANGIKRQLLLDEHEVKQLSVIGAATLEAARSPEQIVADAEVLTRINDQVKYLAPRARKVFMAFVSGATLAECGEEIGVSPERARQIVVKTQKKIRRHLERSGEALQ